jgi:tRNA(Ile)-lysidine synthase
MTSRFDRKRDSARNTNLPLDVKLLRPGMRVAVGLSGGADSVALLRALHERAGGLGLVVHAAHLHHGLRGAEADGDLEFSRALAAKLDVPFHEAHVDTAAAAEPDEKSGKSRETIEEAARRLRYAWFGSLMGGPGPHRPYGTSEGSVDAGFPTLKRGANEHRASGAGFAGEMGMQAANADRIGVVDAVATAHTLDDQAETVLAKFLRGAWTEGLAGIAPRLGDSRGLEFPGGAILRPLLGATRTEIEAYLRGLGQEWREDSTNRNVSFTRNRIRHELLPLLETWNPRLRVHLAQMAELARDEEAWWQAEVERLAPQMILPGRPVRGGGRASGPESAGELAVDAIRLAALAPALQRRLLRHAAKRCGAALDCEATEKLRTLALAGRAGQKLELAGGLRVERTHREVRLKLKGPGREETAKDLPLPEYRCEIPGEIDAAAFGVRLELRPLAAVGTAQKGTGVPQLAILRNWRAGDRVRPRHSSGPRKVKEVLEKMMITGSERVFWPVLEVGGRIVWMKDVELEPEVHLEITVSVKGRVPAEGQDGPG